MPTRFILGFHSLTDLVCTTLQLDKKSIILLFGIIGSFFGNLAGHLYDPKEAVIVLFAIMVADWATGVWKSIRLRRFNSYAFQRMILNMFVAFTLIGLATKASKYLAPFEWIQLPAVLMFAFSATYFLSILENLHEMQLIPEKIYPWLRRLLDLDRVITQFFKVSKVDVPTAEEPKTPNIDPV